MGISLGDAVLAFAGGAAQQYNTIVDEQRQRDIRRQERIEQLLDTVAVKQMESQYQREVDKYHNTEALYSAVANLGGPSTVLGQIKLGADMGFDFNTLVDSGQFGSLQLPQRGEAPVPLTDRISKLMGSMYGEGRKAYADRRRDSWKNKIFTEDGRAIPKDVIARSDGSYNPLDVVESLGFKGSDSGVYATEMSREDLLKAGQAMQKGKEPTVTFDTGDNVAYVTNFDRKGNVESIKAVKPEGIDELLGEAPMDLTETSQLYMNKRTEKVDKLFMDKMGNRYEATAKGPVKIDPNDYMIAPKNVEPKQVTQDYNEMRELRRILEQPGGELDYEQQQRLIFLEGRYSEAVPGAVIDMGNGVTVQETYMRGPFGDMHNVTKFYKAGSQPIQPSVDNVRQARTDFNMIIADSRNEGVDLTPQQRAFAEAWPSIDEKEAPAIATNAYTLMTHYMSGRGDKTYYSQTGAYIQAFEDIARFYDEETERVDLRGLSSEVQRIVGSNAVDTNWIRGVEKFIQENPNKPQSTVYQQALRAGVTNGISFADFLKKRSGKASQ